MISLSPRNSAKIKKKKKYREKNEQIGGTYTTQHNSNMSIGKISRILKFSAVYNFIISNCFVRSGDYFSKR